MAIEGTGTEAGKEGVVAPEAGKTGTTEPVAKPLTQEPKPGEKAGSDWAKEKTGLTSDLQKERNARKALDTQVKDLTSKLEAEIKRVQALAGVAPKSDDTLEADGIREAFGKVFGRLQKLDDPAMFEKFEKLVKMLPMLEQTTQHYWGKHGTDTLTQIEKAIAKEVGSDLTPSQIKKVRAAYVIEAESNPEFAALHENDPAKAIETFTKEWVNDWVEPGKRKALADELARRPHVPTGKDRNLVTGPGGKDIDVNNATAVEDVLVSGFRAKGGRFSRE